jgi:hypothetical protein
MKRLFILLLFLLGSATLASANDSARGWCEEGNRPVVTSGLTSTTRVQASHPSCQVTVLVHGGALATIYADNNLTPLANPFTSQTDGQWQFYAANGRYDVTMSSAGFSQTITYSDILLCDPFVVGSTCNNGGSTTAHNLLSTTHLDTIPASPPVRGDVITAQNQTSPTGVNPSWARLPLGTNGQVLTSNGTDALWATPAGGSGCTLPGVTDTAIVSEHPVTVCYDSADATWDDTNFNMQFGSGGNTRTGTNTNTFTLANGNHLTDVTDSNINGASNTITCDANTLGNSTCDLFIIDGVANTVTDTGIGSSAFATYMYGRGNTLTVTGGGNSSSMMYLMRGNTSTAATSGQIDDSFLVGVTNDLQANGTNSITSSEFVIGEANSVTTSSGGNVEDNMILGENNAIQSAQALSLVGFTDILGYNNSIKTAAGSVSVNYGFQLGHNNKTGPSGTGATATMTDFVEVGHSIILENCTDCFAFGKNIDGTASNSVYLGMSSTAEVVITAGQVKLNAPIVMDPNYIRFVNTTVAGLNTCNSGLKGAIDAVSDSSVTTSGSTVAGGGSSSVEVYCNGTNWLVSGGGSGGGVTGSGTTNTSTKWTSSSAIGNGSMLEDGTHSVRADLGFDVNSLGAYLYWVPNNTGTGTTVNKMVCDDGTGKGIICPFATSTTNDPIGVAVAANGATPGTSGSTGICNIGFCTVVMDNSATANHYAQQSTTVAGDLSDIGTTPPTNGQPYWHIFAGNAGAGTTAIFRNMDSSELNASSGGNGKSTSLLINGTATKNIANVVNGSGITFGVSSSGNTTTVTPTINIGNGSISGTWVNIANNYTVQDTDNVNRLRFTTAAAAITLPQPSTITTNPFVAMRAQVNMGAGGSPFTSSSFATTAGHQMWITVQANGTTTVSSVTMSTGDTCTQQSSTTGANAAYVYFCPNLVGGGSVTISVTYVAGTASQIGLFAVELVGTTFDNAQTGISPSGFSNISLTNPIHFTNAVAIINQQNADNIPPAGFVEKDSLGNTNTGTASIRLLSNANSLSTTSINGISFSQTIASISNHPAFVAGWQVVMENVSTGIQTVTSTSSTINGQTTLVMAPNEICSFLSNGTNWDSVCGFAPNVQTNGVIGGPIEIAGVNTSAAGADQGTTTLITTGAVDAFYEVKGSIACHGVTSTGTSTLTITYTDTSNTVQTLSSGAAACTTLGAASVSQVNPIFRAKASTNIRYAFAHGGTQPTVDVSVAVYQLSTQ